MDNLFEGGIAQLEEIKQAIIDEEKNTFELDQAKDALIRKENEIEEEKQQIEDRIEEVLKAKRDAEFDPHNKEVEQANEVLKESIKRRNAAKEVAVNNRITRETADVHEESIQLDFSIKTLFKNADMPAFCRKPYYYSMFAPKGIKDYIVFIITALIAVALIPILVITLVDTTVIGKVFLYLGIVVFFILVYLAVFFWTQPFKKRKILELARPDMEQIRANKKEMKRLTRSIRNDKDESGYGLEELDNEIIRNRGLYDEAVARREEALRAFEQQITPEVRAEVTGASAEVMNRLQGEREYLQMEYDQKQQAAEALSLKIQRNYSSYIGKKNMHPEKLDQLIGILQEGKAKNILEALDVQKDESRITSIIADAADKIIPDEQAKEKGKAGEDSLQKKSLEIEEILPMEEEEMQIEEADKWRN